MQESCCAIAFGNSSNNKTSIPVVCFKVLFINSCYPRFLYNKCIKIQPSSLHLRHNLNYHETFWKRYPVAHRKTGRIQILTRCRSAWHSEKNHRVQRPQLQHLLLGWIFVQLFRFLINPFHEYTARLNVIEYRNSISPIFFRSLSLHH